MSIDIDFPSTVPAQMSVDSPLSTSKAVLNKSLMEFQPQEQQTYSPGGSNLIRINLSSNHAYVNFPESYIRLKLYRDDNAAFDDLTALDVGGIHACFRSIEVRTLASGTLIQRVNNYNIHYAVKSLVMQDREDVLQKGWVQGDSLYPFEVEAAYQNGSYIGGTDIVSTNSDGQDFTSDAAGTVITVAGGQLLGQVQVGDMFYYNSATLGMNVVAPITAIASNTQFTIGGQGFPVQLVGTATDNYYFQRRVTIPSARRDAIQTTGEGNAVTLCFKPFIGIWQHWLPLWLMKGGIEITFELELGNRCMQTFAGWTAAAANDLDYKIKDVRLMAMMVTPDTEVRNRITEDWNSADGIPYKLNAVRTRKYTGSVAEQDASIQVNVGVRSAHRCYHVIMDSTLSEGSGAATKVNPSISGFLKDFQSDYQYRVGSHEFPNRNVVVTTEAFEAWQQLIDIGRQRVMRLTYGDYSENHGYETTTGNRVQDSRHFINAVSFARDDGVNSNLAGLDLSIVPMDYIVERSAAHNSVWPGSPVHYFFVEHDEYLKLSSEGVVVLN